MQKRNAAVAEGWPNDRISWFYPPSVATGQSGRFQNCSIVKNLPLPGEGSKDNLRGYVLLYVKFLLLSLPFAVGLQVLEFLLGAPLLSRARASRLQRGGRARAQRRVTRGAARLQRLKLLSCFLIVTSAPAAHAPAKCLLMEGRCGRLPA